MSCYTTVYGSVYNPLVMDVGKYTNIVGANSIQGGLCSRQNAGDIIWYIFRVFSVGLFRVDLLCWKDGCTCPRATASSHVISGRPYHKAYHTKGLSSLSHSLMHSELQHWTVNVESG